MKLCRMFRIETRKIFYDKDHKFNFKNPLNSNESAMLEPQFDLIGWGPYHIIKTINNERLSNLFCKGEPWDTYGFYPKSLPSALWKHNRPGPYEDPFLREYWKKLSFYNQINHVFGFAEIDDYKKWFNDSNQISWLMDSGFGIAEYKSKWIKHGLRQSLMPVFAPYKFVSFVQLAKI